MDDDNNPKLLPPTTDDSELPAPPTEAPPLKASQIVSLVLLSVFKGIPYVGSGLGELAGPLLQTGQFSRDQRLMAARMEWIPECLFEINKRLKHLEEQLDPEEQPRASHVGAVLNAGQRVADKTADPGKYRLLCNAAINAFDPDQYKTGMVIRLMGILEDLEYGDIAFLRRVFEIGAKQREAYPDIRLDDLDPRWEETLGPHHVEVLIDKRLLRIVPKRLMVDPERIKLTPLGARLLKLLKDPEFDPDELDAGDDPDTPE